MLNSLAEILLQTPLALTEQKIICKMADRIIAVSQSTRRDCTKYCGVPITDISVIPNGVDINRFSPKISGNKIREVFNIQDAPLILYIGGLNGRKGIRYLILSAPLVLKEINDAKFLLVGKGPHEMSLKRLVRKLGIQDAFIFLPCVSDKDLPELYASADVFVLPSLWEGFGISLLEAMSTAKPVVSTNVSAIPEVVVHNETGLLIEPGDYQQLARNIVMILSDKRFAEKLGYNGRKRVETSFSWDLVARKTLEVYKETLRLYGN
jgi:glycosyltransferase involved in cell wall biosynthesis